MSKKKKIWSDSSPGSIGEQIFAALTHQEIAQLLDALLAALPPDIRNRVLDQLQPDTRQTVQHILSPPQAAGHPQAAQAPPVSLARLEQRWSQLGGMGRYRRRGGARRREIHGARGALGAALL